MSDPLPQGEAKTARVRAMFDTIAPRYDLLNRLMTLGMDERWRQVTVVALGLPEGSLVLDLACGTGDLTRIAQRRGYRVVGTDLSAGMLTRRRGTARGPAAQCDAGALGIASGCVDGVVCGYALRNFTDLAGSLAEAARVLRPGGRIAVLEVAEPTGRLRRRGFRLWFRAVVPALGALLSDRDAYRYLPRSTAYLPGDAELRRIFRQSGFSGVGRRLLAGGLSQVVTGTRVGPPPAAGPDPR